MKFLQIREKGNPIEPRLLEMGIDFDTMRWLGKDNQYLTFIDGNLDTIVNLSDCYQSRQLIEIDGYCEFDVLTDSTGELDLDDEDNYMLLKFNYGTFTTNKYHYCSGSTLSFLENLGSIFLPENIKKYPELYQEALKVIKKYQNI